MKSRKGVKGSRIKIYMSTWRKGRTARRPSTAEPYLHAPDRMPEDPGTILRGVRLRGPGLRRVLSHTRSPRGSNCDWIQPRARQDRVLRPAGIASGPAATVREGVAKARWRTNGGESDSGSTLIRRAGR